MINVCADVIYEAMYLCLVHGMLPKEHRIYVSEITGKNQIYYFNRRFVEWHKKGRTIYFCGKETGIYEVTVQWESRYQQQWRMRQYFFCWQGTQHSICSSQVFIWLKYISAGEKTVDAHLPELEEYVP